MVLIIRQCHWYSMESRMLEVALDDLETKCCARFVVMDPASGHPLVGMLATAVVPHCLGMCRSIVRFALVLRDLAAAFAEMVQKEQSQPTADVDVDLRFR